MNAHSTFQIYKDANRAWRWRLRARNGKVVADGCDGYKRRSNAVGAAERLCADALNAKVIFG